MKEENIKIEDESGDHKYFTIVPNYVLNHSTAIDQAVYLQMKRVAGETGICDISHRTLCSKLGVGLHTFKKSLEYLLKRGWIENTGVKEIDTNGGRQKVNVYKVNDIWKTNNDFYQGASSLAHVDEGGSSLAHNDAQGGSSLAPLEELHKEDNIDIGLKPREELKKFFSDKYFMTKYLKDFYNKNLTERMTFDYFIDKIAKTFYDYWTEPTLNGKKQRWETQQTFGLSQRIFRFVKNDK